VDRWIANKQETAFFYPQSRVDAEEINSSQQPRIAEHQATSIALDSPPSSPSDNPGMIAWVPVSIQALGGDLTTVDAAGEIPEVESESGSDDEYNIAVSLFSFCVAK
jgi:hypothetical protein